MSKRGFNQSKVSVVYKFAARFFKEMGASPVENVEAEGLGRCGIDRKASPPSSSESESAPIENAPMVDSMLSSSLSSLLRLLYRFFLFLYLGNMVFMGREREVR